MLFVVTCVYVLIHWFYSGRRAIIVDLALSVTGSQLIASVLPNVRIPLATLVDLIGLDVTATCLRLTRTSAHSCTSRSVGISSLSAVVRRVRRLFGYCE
jgi:hypothetical protein